MSSPHPAPYNCLDFRRDKLARPRELPAEAADHLAGCAACQAWARRADAIEARIADTLAVPVPEGLAERVLLRTRTHRRPPWQWMALAASLMVALALSVIQYHDRFAEEASISLAEAALQHAREEPIERELHRVSDLGQFPTVLANFGGQIESPLAPVRYLHLCPIKGHGMGWHVVYATPHGDVTLLLVPAKPDGPAVETLEVDGLQVRVQRAGKGYYAIIAHDRASLDAAARDMQSKVRWL